jgi:TnpA family transposase
MDNRIGFTEALVHAGGKVVRSPELVRNIYACLIAQATNLGLVGMAEASGIPCEVLTWTAEWYLRENTLRAANALIVNFHHGLGMVALLGGGALSSPNGQRFPTRGRSITARAMSRYFVDEGISTYTHVRSWATRPAAAQPTVNRALIGDQWDNLPRLAASLKFGHATASLVVGKLSASGPQNTLAAALKEYGLLRRTIYAARYLSDEAYRQRITRQLNKGESLHALRRDLCYAHEGKVRPATTRTRPSRPCAADLFGMERLLFNPDCDFATFVDNPIVTAQVAEAHLPRAGARDERTGS